MALTSRLAPALIALALAAGVAGCLERDSSIYEEGAVRVEGAELAALIAGRTFSGFLAANGEPWAQYAAADGGAVALSNGETHAGVWWVTGPTACFRHEGLFPEQGRCFEVRRTADAALFYFVGFDGAELFKIATEIDDGDPRGLAGALQPRT